MLFSFFVACLVVASSATSSAPHPHVLLPARRGNSVTKRSDAVFLTHEITLIHAEDTPSGSDGLTLTSHLSLEAKEPTLFLDEFDHLLEEIDCSGTTMTVVFRDPDTFSKARRTCGQAHEGLLEGLVVSSHASCSEPKAHGVYSVKGLTFDEATSTFSLDLEKKQLMDAFAYKKLDLKYADPRDVALPPSRIVGRSPEPTITAPEHVESGSLAFSEIDTTFSIAGQPLPFGLGCKNCTGVGNYKLSTTSIEFNDGLDFVDDPFKSGAVQLDLTGFAMWIGLKSSLPKKVKETIPIFTKTLKSIEISDVVSLELDFELGLLITAELHSDVELGFGFDVVVPDSSLRIDIGDPNNSGIDGFVPTITAQQMSANFSDLEFSLSAALSESFPLKFKFANTDATVKPYLALPNFNMTVGQLSTSNNGIDCKLNGKTDDKFKAAFSNLTNVAYAVNVFAGIDFPTPISDPPTFGQQVLQLNPDCLVYKSDGNTPGLQNATTAFEQVTGKKSAGTSLHVSTKSLQSPLVQAATGFLVAACSVMLLL